MHTEEVFFLLVCGTLTRKECCLKTDAIIHGLLFLFDYLSLSGSSFLVMLLYMIGGIYSENVLLLHGCSRNVQ